MLYARILKRNDLEVSPVRSDGVNAKEEALVQGIIVQCLFRKILKIVLLKQ